MARILVVEDDRTMSEALAYNLRREGHTPVTALDAESALRLVRAERFDLLLLDLMLPGGSGLDICRTARATSSVPIIILTARDADVDRVLGLEIGADDYVTKPFSLRELLARIKANLRRVEMDRSEGATKQLECGDLMIDVPQRRASVKGKAMPLQPREFDLLVYMMQRPGIILTRERLLNAVWGHEYVGVRTVDVHVRRVRAKLESAEIPNLIRTVHGVGYGFEPARQVVE